MYNITYSPTNIHVEDSAFIPKKEFNAVLDQAEDTIAVCHQECKVMEQRSRCSLKLEMAAHNLAYDLGIERERTKDVDLNIPQSVWAKIAYAIAGTIAYIFIK